MADGALALAPPSTITLPVVGALRLATCVACGREVIRASMTQGLRRGRRRCSACSHVWGHHAAAIAERDLKPDNAARAPARDPLPADVAPVRGSVTWGRASSAGGQGKGHTVALPEVLESPEGLRLTRLALELEFAAALEVEVVRRAEHHVAGTDPGPIPSALEQLALDLEALPELDPATPAPPPLPPPHPITAPELVLERPKERRHMAKTISWNGKNKTAAEWALELGCSVSMVYHREKKGLNPDGSQRDGSEASEPPKARRKPAAPAPTEGAEDAEVTEVASEHVDVEQLLELAGIEHQVVSRTARGTMVFFPGTSTT
jgi:hypothetical protein